MRHIKFARTQFITTGLNGTFFWTQAKIICEFIKLNNRLEVDLRLKRQLL